jgi:2-polyprenyl-6-methoxyphenol hydroxylase-like FAD-dependent oxidoreductase
MSTKASSAVRSSSAAAPRTDGPRFDHDVVVVGGCGHAGLPLGLALGQCGMSVVLFDTNQAAVDIVNEGRLPFDEEGAQAPLVELRATGRLVATTTSEVLGSAEYRSGRLAIPRADLRPARRWLQWRAPRRHSW